MKFRFELTPFVEIGSAGSTADIGADPAAGSHAAGQMLALLGAIRATGSLQRAALTVGLSYRHAWGTIRHWETLLDRSIVSMQRGKGAELTRFGEDLIAAESRMRETVEPMIETATADFHQYLGNALGSRAQVRFSGRPDATIDVVRQSLTHAETTVSLDTVFCGAVDGLICLHERQAELAGFHVSPIHQAGTRVHTAFRPWLKPSDVRLIRLAWRDQGLMVAPAMSTAVRGVKDLVTRRVRFINRERSSATRALFDQVVANEGAYPEQIAGYDNYAMSNRQVGEAIQQGHADAGFGLRSTADALGLDFVPLTREAYYLALRNSDRDAAWVSDLLELLSSDRVAGRIGAIPGYQPETSLKLMPLHEALPW